MSAEATGCPAEKWDGWHSRTCGKPIKRDGLCGVHAAAKERRMANDAKRREGERRRAEAAYNARERLAAHGVTYQHSFSPTQVADILDAHGVTS